jgi:hypothetical protein
MRLRDHEGDQLSLLEQGRHGLERKDARGSREDEDHGRCPTNSEANKTEGGGWRWERGGSSLNVP